MYLKAPNYYMYRFKCLKRTFNNTSNHIKRAIENLKEKYDLKQRTII